MVKFYVGISPDEVRSTELEYVLSQTKVMDIKELIRRLGVPVKKSLRKDDLCMALTDYLRSHPECIVDKMGADEVLLTQRLLKGESVKGDTRVLFEFYLIIRLGWAALREIHDGSEECEVILLEEAEHLLRPLVEGLQISMPRKIARFVQSWSALCGALPIKRVVDYMRRLPEFEGVDSVAVRNSIDAYCNPNDLMYKPIYDKGRGDDVFMTPWWRVTDSQIPIECDTVSSEGVTKRVNVYDPVEFSYDKVMAASMPLFAPATPNVKERTALEKLLKDFGMNEIAIESAILGFWIEKQQDKDNSNPSSIQSIFRFLKDLNDYRTVMFAVTDYMNTIPFWRFGGRSSYEILMKKTGGVEENQRSVREYYLKESESRRMRMPTKAEVAARMTYNPYA